MTRDEQILSLRSQVEYHAHRMARRNPGMYEDFCSEGWIGAIQATDAFIPDRGIRLTTFAERRILGAMIDAVRRQSEDKRRRTGGASEAHHVIVLQLEKIHLRGRSSDGDLRGMDAHISLGWLMAGAALTPQQRHALELVFGPSELSLMDVGRALGCSNARVFEIKHQALAKLRAAA